MKLITLDQVYDIWYKMKRPHVYFIDEDIIREIPCLEEIRRLPIVSYSGYSISEMKTNFNYFCTFFKHFLGYKII